VRFRATIESAGKTATGVEVPAKVVDGLGSTKRPKVRATIKGHTYRSSVASLGGRYMLGISAEVREAAGVEAGDVVDVELELDTEVREVEVPTELQKALRGDAAARGVFEALSFSRKQRLTLPIAKGKTPETRQRNLDRALAALREGSA
jgi:hypothetical protein